MIAMTAWMLAADNLETMQQGWGSMIFSGVFVLTGIGFVIWWLLR